MITPAPHGKFLDECFDGIVRQSQKPAAVVVVIDGNPQWDRSRLRLEREGWRIVEKKRASRGSSWATGVEAIVRSGLTPLGFAFLSGKEQLRPDYVSVCESALRRCPEVGIISFWVGHAKTAGRMWMKPCPAFPYQWFSNDVVRFGAIKTDALLEAGNLSQITSEGYEDWDLCNAILEKGWVAVTIPEVLGDYTMNDLLPGSSTPRERGVRREFLERFPKMVARDMNRINALIGNPDAAAGAEKGWRLRRQLVLFGLIASKPRATFRVLAGLVAKLIQRTAA